jgi:flagellar basal body-associated protein FliL
MSIKTPSSIHRQLGNTTMSFVLLAALLINAVVIGAGGYYFWHQKKVVERELEDAKKKSAGKDKPSDSPSEKQASGASESQGLKETQEKVYFKKVVPFEPVLTNLSGDNGRRILRLTLEVEFEGENVLHDVEKLKPVLRDVIVSAAGSMDFETANKNESRDLLRDKIMQGINSHLSSGNKAVQVYFSEYETN